MTFLMFLGSSCSNFISFVTFLANRRRADRHHRFIRCRPQKPIADSEPDIK